MSKARPFRSVPATDVAARSDVLRRLELELLRRLDGRASGRLDRPLVEADGALDLAPRLGASLIGSVAAGRSRGSRQRQDVGVSKAAHSPCPAGGGAPLTTRSISARIPTIE